MANNHLKQNKQAKKLRIQVGFKYKGADGKTVEIVGRLRGGDDFDYIGIVRNYLGPRSDAIRSYNKNGVPEFGLGAVVKQIGEIKPR